MSSHEMVAGLSDEPRIAKHLRHINKFPLLEKEEEFILISQWLKEGNKESLTKIIKSHMRLVARIAQGYRGFGLPIDELIAEGHIGVMQALKHFQPEKGFRFSTYALHWIKATLQDYIFRSSSILKIGKNKDYKKVFFKIKWLKNALGLNMQDNLSDQNITQIAKILDVSEKSVKVIEENSKITSNALSINTKENEDGKEGIDWLNLDGNNLELSIMEKEELDYRKNLLATSLKTLNKTEYEILANRRLSDEPKSLNEIASKLSLSRERVRQIEITAFDKLKKHIINLSNSHKNRTFSGISAAGLRSIGILLALLSSLAEFLSKFCNFKFSAFVEQNDFVQNSK